MKTWTSALWLMMTLVACGCDTSGSMRSNGRNPGHKPEESTSIATPHRQALTDLPGPGTYVGDWSEPVTGLSARLVVTVQEGNTPSSLFAMPIILELKNTESTPLAVIDQPSFTGAAIRDADGRALPESVRPGNHLQGAPQWAVIPGHAYLGLRVDTSIPVDVGLCFGVIPPEARTLSATLVAKHREGPENQWVGEIKLPPVALTPSSVTTRKGESPKSGQAKD